LIHQAWECVLNKEIVTTQGMPLLAIFLKAVRQEKCGFFGFFLVKRQNCLYFLRRSVLVGAVQIV